MSAKEFSSSENPTRREAATNSVYTAVRPKQGHHYFTNAIMTKRSESTVENQSSATYSIGNSQRKNVVMKPRLSASTAAQS